MLTVGHESPLILLRKSLNRLCTIEFNNFEITFELIANVNEINKQIENNQKIKHYKQFCWHIEKSLIEFGITYENFIVSTHINGN